MSSECTTGCVGCVNIDTTDSYVLGGAVSSECTTGGVRCVNIDTTDSC